MNESISSQIEDVGLCKRDPVYFIEHYLHWELNDLDQSTIKQLHESTGIIPIGDSNQFGLRWILVAYALWGTVFNSDVQYGFICDDQDRTSGLRHLYFELHDSLPQWMKCDIHTCNQHYIRLINNSTIRFINAGHKTCGLGFNTVIISCHDERKFDEIKQALYPVVLSTKHGKVIEWID
jgi:hypothetical protein